MLKKNSIGPGAFQSSFVFVNADWFCWKGGCTIYKSRKYQTLGL